MNELLLHTSIRDIITSFSHAVEEKTGRPFPSFKWPNRLIYFHLINVRADLYYQTRKQNHVEGNYEDYTEVIPCMDMEEVDVVECPCAPASGCTFMKSVYPVPAFVGGKPVSVTNLTGFDRYDYVDWAGFRTRINSRHQAQSQARLYTTKTIANETWLYTYITTDIKARAIQVSGVPVDPMEIALYPVCGQKPEQQCNILDLKFIIEKRLINTLFDVTYRKLITINNGTRVGDTKNDDRNAETATDPRF